MLAFSKKWNHGILKQYYDSDNNERNGDGQYGTQSMDL
jgi:hypothetical protein